MQAQPAIVAKKEYVNVNMTAFIETQQQIGDGIATENATILGILFINIVFLAMDMTFLSI
ncbi:MAG: hypothetical protein FD167_3186 [bacterium]|nr:MAG: hypothetical protein FD167_3186 [bacterium]